MSISRIAHIPQILESPSAMKKFFDSTDDIRKIKKLADKPPYEPSKEPSVFIPFKAVAMLTGVVFFSAIHSLSKLLGAHRLTIRSEVLKGHYLDRLNQILPEQSRLVPMKNRSRLDHVGFHCSKPISSPQGMFNFSHASGHCAGISHWFNYLYLKTRSTFSSVQSHIRAVSKRFEKGSPLEAAFIQCHQQSFGVGKSFEQISKSLKIKYTFKLLKPSKKQDEIEDVAKKIFALSPGCYFMIIPVKKSCAHAVSFVREKNDRFFIDANFGAAEIRNPLNLEFFISEYMTTKNRAKHPKGAILIYKAQLTR